MPGILILDNNCYSYLSKPAALSAFRSNLRVNDFIAQPTEVNLLEAAAAPPRIRSRLIDVIRVLIGDQPLLIWPFGLLKQIGHAILEGSSVVSIGASGKEWYLEDNNAIAALQEELKQFQTQLETAFDQLHARNRIRLQKGMRLRGIRDRFESTAQFLESEWQEMETRTDYANATWSALGLPGKAPLAALSQNECWRLLLDAEGVAVYERAIAKTQPKFVHRMDLIQMTYLGLAKRRIIATADKPFLQAANAILTGRYSNSRAVHIGDLI